MSMIIGISTITMYFYNYWHTFTSCPNISKTVFIWNNAILWSHAEEKILFEIMEEDNVFKMLQSCWNCFFKCFISSHQCDVGLSISLLATNHGFLKSTRFGWLLSTIYIYFIWNQHHFLTCFDQEKDIYILPKVQCLVKWFYCMKMDFARIWSI